ncbi:MCP four helix bundle domain-containing protein, partial [Goekera deserti]
MSTKVLTAVGVAAAVGVGVGVMGLSSLSSAADGSRMLYESNIAGITAAGQMMDAVTRVRLDNRDAVLEPDPVKTQVILDDIEVQADAFAAAEQTYLEDTFATPEKKAMVEEASVAFDQFVTLSLTKLGPLGIAADTATWYVVNAQEVRPVAQQVDDLLTQVQTIENGEARQAAADAQAAYETQRTRSVLLLVVGIVAALAIGFLVARGIARSLGRVQVTADALAAGDLTASSGLTTQDELGRMGRSLDTAMAGLRSMMGSVVASAEAVAASSEELSASSAQISASAEETSAQSGVVSAAAEEVSRNVGTVSAGAEQMGASIREISQNANEAARVAASAVAEAQSTNDTVLKLGESS